MGSGGSLTPVLVKGGAYVADALDARAIDFDEWQYWRLDPAVAVHACGRGLRVAGTSTVDRRAFSGLVSRHLYPADAALVCEVKVPMGTGQPGTYGAVVHLCNRLVGDEVKTLEIPDNNGELTFGRFEDRAGWFRWYYDQLAENFHKWKAGAAPDSPPLGTEAEEFSTVRVEFSEPDSLLSAWLLDDGAWRRIGEPVRMSKLFSSVELKVDARGAGLEVEALFRNCRLYPQPERNPVRLFAGSQSVPARNVRVELLAEEGEGVLAAGTTDESGLVGLGLNPGLVLPVGGRFRLHLPEGPRETAAVRASGVRGIYPGDFYAVDPGG
ncbi:MAG: hypothetical protein ACYTGB_14890 [Planctomycetota bacterium]|jgi:hypothetical protein